jgi:hypothetical protein
VRDREGAEVWLVAVKATFDILEDCSTAAGYATMAYYTCAMLTS